MNAVDRLLAEVFAQYERRNAAYQDCAEGASLPDQHVMSVLLDAKQIRAALRSIKRKKS